LRSTEAGIPLTGHRYQHRFSEDSRYLWSSRMDAMSAPYAKRLNDLEAGKNGLEKVFTVQIITREACTRHY